MPTRDVPLPPDNMRKMLSNKMSQCHLKNQNLKAEVIFRIAWRVKIGTKHEIRDTQG
jgi:hypothetical protein